ncbi:NS1 [Solenopsis invicta densovirus]|uniref:NS1 n=1 Tax=Solenopsis invicta densovirus TaxID=1414671 RepID=U5TRM7_9VIRU|nr:NS1 [Solenopsis invicta densovirus]AGZ03694.1 NS1 [Solenopsis invicta densovirus]
MEPEEPGESVVRCEHFNGGSEFDNALRLRYIKRHLPEDYNKLEILRQGVVGRYVREITRQAFGNTRKYASDVYLTRDEEQRARMLRRLSEFSVSYPGKVLIWVDEGDHIHIVHDCPHSNGQCRCHFKRTEDFRRDLRTPMRRYRYITEMDELDWTNVILYFVMQKRESNSQVWIGGRLQRSPDSNESLRWEDLQRESRSILARENQGNGRDLQLEERYSEDSRGSIHSGTSSSRQKRSYDEDDRGKRELPKKRSKFERISSAVHTLLNKYFVLPSNHIRDIMLGDSQYNFLFDPSNDKAYMASCEIFQKKFIPLKLKDLRDIFEGSTPVFYANNIDPNLYYHDRETSFKFVDDLLRFQYNDSEENIVELLTNVRDWFNLDGWNKNPKMNALCVIGPPNSGKNYFWDMFCSVAYNVGHIGRVNNKTNQFALQECYGRRLVVGNEVSMEDGAKEDFKKLCEGTAFNIRVKYQGDKIFTKAPVLLISNFELDICYDTHFKNVRLHTIRWVKCPLLKDSNKKPYPLCIFDLFNKYNIELYPCLNNPSHILTNGLIL